MFSFKNKAKPLKWRHNLKMDLVAFILRQYALYNPYCHSYLFLGPFTSLFHLHVLYIITRFIIRYRKGWTNNFLRAIKNYSEEDHYSF